MWMVPLCFVPFAAIHMCLFLGRSATEEGEGLLLTPAPPKVARVRAKLYSRETGNGRPNTAAPNLYELAPENVTIEDPRIKRTLCNISVPEKVVAGRYFYRISLPDGDRSGRLIPKKIHQSWFEHINATAYPKLFRVTNSWRVYGSAAASGGWSYNFYSDAEAAKFIADHFPPQVLDAFHAVMPGAFKADLFRYCVLFIEGGIWADVDVLLTSNLDLLFPDDVGFAVPLDEFRGGLWNGLIASAPGHPLLAGAIEMAVNHIRHRFTIIDLAGLFCPGISNKRSLAKHSNLYLTGPGLLGMAVNSVLGLPKDNIFKEGKLRACENQAEVVGSCVLLRQGRGDLRAFTYVERNILVAQPDFISPDRKSTNPRYGYPAGYVWGTKGVYYDLVSAKEEIRIIISSD